MKIEHKVWTRKKCSSKNNTSHLSKNHSNVLGVLKYINAHTLLSHRSTFSFDGSAHLSWCRTGKIMQCHIYFHPELHYVFTKCKVFAEQSPKFWIGSKCKLCGGQCMCKNDVSHILSQMKPNIVILEYGIRKKKNPWWKNLVIQYVQVHGWPHFWAPDVTKPRPTVHSKPLFV